MGLHRCKGLTESDISFILFLNDLHRSINLSQDSPDEPLENATKE